MSSSLAWVLHGCFQGNASYQYYKIPFDKVRNGCNDISQTYDHFDITSPHYTLLKQMHELRIVYPVLNDGLSVQTISRQIKTVYVPTLDYVTNYSNHYLSDNIAIQGVWSVSRKYLAPQSKPVDLAVDMVWLVYSNLEVQWQGNCSDGEILSPFKVGTVIRNLFPPYEVHTETGSACKDGIILPPFGFKAFVEASKWVKTSPVIVKFSPGMLSLLKIGHDERILRPESIAEGSMKIPFAFYFSDIMDCESVASSLIFEVGELVLNSISCKNDYQELGSNIQPIRWKLECIVQNIADGVFYVSIGKNAKAADLRTIQVNYYSVNFSSPQSS